MPLSEMGLATIMQVSITGAGLLLAIYALIIPVSRRIFIERALRLKQAREDFESQRKLLNADATSKQFKNLQSLSNEIKQTREFPKLLSVGVAFAFFLYVMAAYLSGLTLGNFSTDGLPYSTEVVINLLWVSGTTLFLVIGVSTAASISSAMRKEYEEIKKELELKEPVKSIVVEQAL